MDYEKAYKAVLKTATQWIKDGCTDKEKICLECVFPELRESEDERIRKALVEYHKEQFEKNRDQEIGLFHKDALAYLEKQKEKKPAEWSEEDEKVYEYLKSGFEYTTNNPQLLASRLWGGSDATIQDYKNFVDKLKSLRPQPKRDGGDDYNKGYTEGYNKGYKDANESVSYHFPVMPTTPSGWGCDGTHCTNPQMDCINCPKKSTGGMFNTASSSGDPTLKAEWKPSEEQIGALNHAYCELFKREDVGHNILGPLQKLCDDLKKLK